jgi:hypothetical protein
MQKIGTTYAVIETNMILLLGAHFGERNSSSELNHSLSFDCRMGNINRKISS